MYLDCVLFFFPFRGEQTWFPWLLRPWTDVRDSQNATLCTLLLQAVLQTKVRWPAISPKRARPPRGKSPTMVNVCCYRSSDSRILYALGCCHLELQQYEEAKKVIYTPEYSELSVSSENFWLRAGVAWYSPISWLAIIEDYFYAVSGPSHCIQRPRGNSSHKACQVIVTVR